jgi:tetratricopeptide (TPR) repeat protein
MKSVFMLLLISVLSISLYSQNSNEKAKELYFKALELHESKKYAESNEKLKEAQNILVSNNLTIQYLRVKNFYALKNHEQTKKEISLYLKLNPKQDEAYTEIMKYKGEIEEKERKKLELVPTTSSAVPSVSLLRNKLASFNFDTTKKLVSIEEAQKILLAFGVNEVYRTQQSNAEPFIYGYLNDEYAVTVWVGTYGKTDRYGVRFGKKDFSYHATNDSYFEIIRP